MDQRNTIVISFIWKLLERFSAQAISLGVTIILARLLLPAEFGIVAIIAVFINLANVIIDGGLSTALIQKKDADNTDFSTITFFSLAVAVVLYALLSCLAPSIARFYSQPLLTPIIRVLGINLILNSYNAIQRAYIAKHMLFNKLFYCSLTAISISGLTGVVMAYRGWGVWALVGQQLANQIALTAIMSYAIPWRPVLVFSSERFRGLFDYGWKIFLSNFIIAIYENLRSLIIGKIYQPATLAYFDRGKQFPDLITTNINMSLQTVLLPAFSDIQDERSRVKEMMKNAVKITNFFILPLLVGLMVTAKPLVLLVLTEKWLDAVPFIQIFCVAFMLIPIQSTNMSAIKALGYSGITLKIELIKKAVETCILIVSFLIDVYAVAWGIVIYNLICIAINLYPTKKILNYGIGEQTHDVLPYLLTAAAMGGVLFAISQLECPLSLLLCVQMLSGAVIYLSLNAVFKTSGYLYIRSFIVKRTT